MSADCPNCARLQREVREAREELAEWVTAASRPDLQQAELDRLARWGQRLRVRHGAVLAVMKLADRAGRLVTKAQITEAARASPHLNLKQGEEVSSKLPDVLIHHARAALKTLDPTLRIETVWGAGWTVSPETALRLTALMDDA